jgi:hypothetical protein
MQAQYRLKEQTARDWNRTVELYPGERNLKAIRNPSLTLFPPRYSLKGRLANVPGRTVLVVRLAAVSILNWRTLLSA